MRSLLAALLALGLASCNTGFDPQYRVTDLRILAVRTQVQGNTKLADATPGQTVLIDALVYPGNRTGVTVKWYGCAPTADETLPPCADPAYLAAPERLAAEAATPGSRVVLLGSCALVAEPDRCGIAVPVPASPSVLAALDFVISIAVQEPAFTCSLYAEMPVVAVAEAEGRSEVALKRVRIVPTDAQLAAHGISSRAYVLNQNPQEVSVRLRPQDGTCANAIGAIPILSSSSLPPDNSFLCAHTDDFAQQYYVCGPAGELDPTIEDFDWQWYTTSGEFPEFDGIGNATGSEVEFVRPPEPLTMWLILRDGRGGEDWLRLSP